MNQKADKSMATTGTAATALALAAILIGTAGCSVNMSVEQDPLAHVVLVWLKEPGNVAHRSQIVNASKRLEAIDGVIRVDAGQSIPSDRAVVDDSFDVGLYIELESPQALQAYATDPLHLEILKNDIAPLTERYIVYDFTIKR